MAVMLEFEKPVAALETEMAAVGAGDTRRRDVLAARREKLLAAIYGRLSPWQKVQVARHPARPHFLAYAESLFTEFTPLGGDRKFAEDAAIIGGPARLNGRPVMLIGHEKGDTTEARVKRNFGMAKPEGYRKAVRLMEMASQFSMPIITLVDTSGAFPGIEAEERGQAEAIARSTEACLAATVPLLSVVIGEGGSGGAVAIAAGNRVLMLEHAVYAVISPEGCASILWRDRARAADAADAMKLTAQDLLGLGVIDSIVPEPLGGAHRDPAGAAAALGAALGDALGALSGLCAEELRADRRARFRRFAGGLSTRAA